ncbi:MAG: pilus assembly PilX N-terminal domain-containing protein [Syntrophales bacterium]|jgi:hypothetical protein|nr:pilus assembly PilX N-terminal domain-containing protein [Syntrophales bacterium]MDY0044590.1 pilus assembly PilX N-terminal domain-containing protein [Syntrophales bacterium]
MKSSLRGQDERGMVLVTVVLLMAVLMALGTTAILQTSTNVKISGNYTLNRQTFFGAEAGIKSVIAYYLNNPAAYAGRTAAGAMGIATSKPSSANLGTGQGFWISSVTYGSGSPPAWVQIESKGTVPGTNAVSTVTARYSPIYGSLFSFGAFGDLGLTFTGKGNIDSYDSDLGAYNSATNCNENGDVGTNAVGIGSIDVSGGNASVKGRAVCGPGGDPAVAITEKFAGQITGMKSSASALQDMTAMVDPGGGTAATLNSGSSATTTFSTGTYRLSEIKLASKQKIVIDGDVILYVNGDIETRGQSEFTVNTGASLIMYVSGDIDMAGQGVINATNTPSNLMIFGSSTCTDIVLSGQADLYAAVHAPKADITLTGQGDVYGAFVGRTAALKGQGATHYDEALGRLNKGGPLTGFNINSWRDDSV